MRIARFAHQQGISWGGLHGDADAGADHADQVRIAEIKDHPFGTPEFTGRTWSLPDVRLLSPVLPSKVVGVGRNYADGSRPQRPLIFLKPSSSVIGPGMPIRLPWDSEQVDFEGELAVVIGTVLREATEDSALDGVLGYTCANDITARDQQKADGQWTRAKGHDTFCPLGPWLETSLDPFDVSVRTEVDGTLRQEGSTSDMIFDVREIVAFVSSVMTLLPGDVILTGTPAGMGPLRPGQTVSVTIDGIGTLSNPVEER